LKNQDVAACLIQHTQVSNLGLVNFRDEVRHFGMTSALGVQIHEALHVAESFQVLREIGDEQLSPRTQRAEEFGG
jgi:hypothetical protein